MSGVKCGARRGGEDRGGGSRGREGASHCRPIRHPSRYGSVSTTAAARLEGRGTRSRGRGNPRLFVSRAAGGKRGPGADASIAAGLSFELLSRPGPEMLVHFLFVEAGVAAKPRGSTLRGAAFAPPRPHGPSPRPSFGACARPVSPEPQPHSSPPFRHFSLRNPLLPPTPAPRSGADLGPLPHRISHSGAGPRPTPRSPRPGAVRRSGRRAVRGRG